MAAKTKMSPVVWVLPVVVLAAGCGYNQQAKFQMHFLPPAPKSAPPVDVPEPPPHPNLFLKTEVLPAVVLNNTSIPRRRTEADASIQNAESAFRMGRRLYFSKNLEGARTEFDRAIDLMLQASDQDPADRQEFEHKLEEMT